MVKPGDMLGLIAGRNKVDGEKKARTKFDISDRVKVRLDFRYADPPYKVYEVTVSEIKPIKPRKMPKEWEKKFNLAFDKHYGAK